MRSLAPSILLVALVSVAPFARLYSRNLGNAIDAFELALWAIAWTSFWVIALLLGRALLRADTRRAACVCATSAFVAFSYGALADALGEGGGALAFVAIGALSVAAAVRFGGRPVVHRAALVFAALSLLLPLFSVISYRPPPRGPALPLEAAFPLADNAIWSGAPVRTPNVYWLVADSYPNARVLAEQFGFDNRPFLNALGERGFYVSNASYASFSNTLLSVSSTLDMVYLYEPTERFSELRSGVRVTLPGRANRGPVETTVGDNRTVGFLKQAGYRYVHFEGRTYHITRCRGYEDVCITGMPTRPSDLQSVLLEMLPYRLPFALAGGDAPMARPVVKGDRSASGTGIPELAAGLRALPRDRPFFVYAHIFSPHGPYSNDEHCNLLERSPPRPTSADYLRQLQCVNRQLLGLLDQISRDDPSAVVLLNSDHGPRLTVHHEVAIDDYDADQIRETLGILNAVRLPPVCREDLAQDLIPANVMRIVFACLGGHPARLLEPRHFVAAGNAGHPDYGRIREVRVR